MTKSATDKLAAVTKVPERQDVHFTFDDVTLVDEQSKVLNWNLTDSLTSAQVGLTMSGASTVTLQFEDDDYLFLNDPVLAKWAFSIQDVSVSSQRTFSTHRITAATDNVRAGLSADNQWILGQRPIDLFLDTIAFRLCQIQTQQTLLTLTFEDRVASLLRDKRGFKTATRGTLTRAAFVRKICQEAGVDYWIPEIDVVQPITKSSQTQRTSSSRSSGGAGITTFMGLTQKGQALTQGQVDIVNTGLQVGVSLSAPLKAQVAYVEALITENDISNPNPGSSGDEGSLSIISSTAAGLSFSPYDVGAVANYFFSSGFSGQGGAISIANGNPSIPAYQIAQAVQGSGAGASSNGAATYGAQEAEATRIVQAFGGAPAGALPASVPGTYAFTRGPNEDSWDVIQRLASEVGWYAFVRENRLWFVSGDYLFAQQPQLSVARGENGIDYVDVDLDMGARDQIAEVTVTGRTHLWTALPGMTVQVNNRGPANGRWSTDEIVLDLLDESNGCTITLHKPLPARPEPSALATNPTSATSFGGQPGSAQAAYQAAQALSNMGLPYLYGGGHQAAGLDNVHAGGSGLDCSGAVSWVLHQAGMFPANVAEVSGQFAASWGVPGPGAMMTIWANSGHVWIEFNLPGLHMQLNTVSPGDVGPRLYPYGPPGGNPAGFTARHWPNT